MAEITASMVKELRERTDAPMMDCKKALSEADGDMTRAEEILRVRFGNKASKAAGRVAAEGTVGVSISADGKTGAMIEVNSETDFCAKNDDFLNYVRELAFLIKTRMTASASRSATVTGVPSALISIEVSSCAWAFKIPGRAASAKTSANLSSSTWRASVSMKTMGKVNESTLQAKTIKD